MSNTNRARNRRVPVSRATLRQNITARELAREALNYGRIAR